MRSLRTVFMVFLMTLPAGRVWAQFGMYGAPDSLHLPQVQSSPVAAMPQVQPQPMAAQQVQPQPMAAQQMPAYMPVYMPAAQPAAAAMPQTGQPMVGVVQTPQTMTYAMPAARPVPQPVYAAQSPQYGSAYAPSDPSLAVPMHIAEAANIHQDVEAKLLPRAKRPLHLVMFSPMSQRQIDDLL